MMRNGLWDKFWKPKSLAQLEYDIDALEDNRKRRKLYYQELEKDVRIEQVKSQFENRQKRRAERAARRAKAELEAKNNNNNAINFHGDGDNSASGKGLTLIMMTIQ